MQVVTEYSTNLSHILMLHLVAVYFLVGKLPSEYTENIIANGTIIANRTRIEPDLRWFATKSQAEGGRWSMELPIHTFQLVCVD